MYNHPKLFMLDVNTAYDGASKNINVDMLYMFKRRTVVSLTYKQFSFILILVGSACFDDHRVTSLTVL